MGENIHNVGHRASRSAMGTETPGRNSHSNKRQSFAAPPKMTRLNSAGSIPSQGRRISQRPGTGASSNLSPPGTASSQSFTDNEPKVESSASEKLFYLDEASTRPLTSFSKPRRLTSSVLADGEIPAKPWIERRDPRARFAYLLTIFVASFGIAASFLRCFFGAKSVQLLDGNLCLVLEDDFNGPGIDTSKWSWDVAMDGFGYVVLIPNLSFLHVSLFVRLSFSHFVTLCWTNGTHSFSL
jgi:hypothetical protein